MSAADSWRGIVEDGCYTGNIHKHFGWELRYQAVNLHLDLLIAVPYGIVLFFFI